MWAANIAGYRAEIDGLRALAILPVLLFHLGVGGFDGGYVGVDVFFVISGYLITSLIQREIDRGEFSFARFWERRARRILPALTVVVLFSLVAAWFIFIPADFEALGGSAFAQSLFASNVLFWLHSGYFDKDAVTKPLLHTWSLSVEEQFYICFPFVLVLLGVISRLARVRIIVGILLLSFLLSIYGVSSHPTAAFYLLPMRAWELLLGCLLALAPGLISRTYSARWDEILAWLGLAAIAAAVLGYDRETPFPGLAALLPCLGVAAVIWSNEHRRTVVGRLLAVKPLVQIGLISYSLYLWHWPLIVFANYGSAAEPSTLKTCVIIAMSFSLAWLSWRFVESPVRRRIVFGNRARLAAGATCGLAVAAGLGLAAKVEAGYPWRLPPDALRYARAADDINPRRGECHLISFEATKPLELCRLGPAADDREPNLLVWGDSHADALMPVLDVLAADYSVSAWFASHAGCPPIQGVFSPARRNFECPEFNKAVLKFAKEHRVGQLVLIANWSLYTEGRENGEMSSLINDAAWLPESPRVSRRVFERRFADTVAMLLKDGFTMWIVEQVPLQRFSPPQRLTLISLLGRNARALGRPLSEHIARQSFVSSILERAAGDRVRLLDPADLLCTEKGRCATVRNGYSLYRDEQHLSRFGALQMRPIFEPIFQAVVKAKSDACDRPGFRRRIGC